MKQSELLAWAADYERGIMRKFLTALLLITVILVPGIALASGYAVWEMGARSSAMGGTMTAHPVDASAMFYNPAGLTSYCGDRLTFGLTGIKPYTEFAGVDPHPGAGVSERLVKSLFILPNVYYSHRLSKSLAMGIGFCTPYGLAVEWENPESFSGRNIATLTDLKTYFFTPSLAWRPSEIFSLGAGLNIVKSTVELRQGLVEDIPNPTDVGTATITGNSDMAYGLNLGLLLQPNPRVSLGLNYKSRIDLNFSGDADFTPYAGYESVLPADGPAETAMPLPALYSAGLSAYLGPKLRAEFNYNYILWSSFETLKLSFLDTPEVDKTIEENYEDQKQFRIGLEYEYCEFLQLRAGWLRDISPQPDASTGPVLPDANRTGYSVGTGYRLSPNLSLDSYALFLFLDDRQVRDNYDGFNGDYHSFTYLFGFGLNYLF